MKKINKMPTLQTTYELNLEYQINNHDVIRKNIFDKIDWTINRGYGFPLSSMVEWFENNICKRNYNIILMSFNEYENHLGNRCYLISCYDLIDKKCCNIYLYLENQVERYKYYE